MTEESPKAFQTIKQLYINTPISSFADISKLFKVHTDASGILLGAVLYQEQDAVDRAIGNTSRALSKSESHYATHKLEFLALKWALTHSFHEYFIVIPLPCTQTVIH